MVTSEKVIWKEGMFLQPQHLQQAHRAMADAIDNRLAAGVPFGYGFNSISVNSDACANGVVSLMHAAGVMPDGAWFDMPSRQALPRPRPVGGHLDLQKRETTVYLALPLGRDGARNIAATDEAAAGQRSCRYISRTVSIADETLGGPGMDIEVAMPWFTLLFDDEERDGYSVLPVARLTRNAAGAVVPDESFIPPLIRIGASQILINRLHALLQLLVARATSLSQGRVRKSDGSARFSTADDRAFRMLYALNASLPLINYYQASKTAHPFVLYQALVQLAGGLCTFSGDATPMDCPHFNHDRPDITFGELDALIRRILDSEIDTGSAVFPFEKINEVTYAARVRPATLFAAAEFYLGVSAAAPEKELIVGVLQRIKISSRERLDLLISSAMPGLPVVHIPHPPVELATKPGSVYFVLDKQNPLWEAISAASAIACYFPHNYPDLKLEILSLKR